MVSTSFQSSLSSLAQILTCQCHSKRGNGRNNIIYSLVSGSGRKYIAFSSPSTIPDDSPVRSVRRDWHKTFDCHPGQKSYAPKLVVYPPPSWAANNLHDLSLDTDNTNRSSGLNAILVTVKECPSKGLPTRRYCAVS